MTGVLLEVRVDLDAALVSRASMPRQMVMGAAGWPSCAPESSTLFVNNRPPPPLELMADDAQIGVRGPTTVLTS